MKNIILFFRTNIRRNLLSLYIAVGGGIILCLFFAISGEQFGTKEAQKVVVGVMDEDKSLLSQDFLYYLTDSLNLKVNKGKSYDSLVNQLIERKISAIIEIPEGLEGIAVKNQALGKITVTTLQDYENTAFLRAYIDSYCSSIHQIMQASKNNTQVFNQLMQEFNRSNERITQKAAYNVDKVADYIKEGFTFSMGFFVMFVFGIGLCVAFIIYEDRVNGVFNRMVISPVRGIEYITGTSLFSIFTGAVMIGIYCGFIKWKQYQIGVPIGILFYMMLMLVLIMIGFSIIAALTLNSKNAVLSCVLAFGTIGALVGGSYFSLDMAPLMIQKISKLTPQYWFMQGVRNRMDHAKADISINMIILTLFAVMFFLIAAVKFVKKESSRS